MAQGNSAVVANSADIAKAATQKAADDAAKAALGKNAVLVRPHDPTVGGEWFGYGR